MENEIVLVLTEEEMETYKAMGVDPKVAILNVHGQIFRVLREAENIYAVTQEYDEKHISQAIIDAGIKLSEDRKKLLEHRKKKAELLKQQKPVKGSAEKRPCPKKRESM